MKKILFIAAVLFLTISSAFSQTVPYHVVFDVTNDDPAVQQRMITLVKEIIGSRPNAKVEVVFYGNSMGMVDKSKSSVSDEISKLSQNHQVAFKVCAVAMKKHHVDQGQLVSGVQSVPDGIYEIIERQAEGYGYIKVVQ
ncbi:MAG: DsrE family protein [Ginsengibacter sp.]